jgi:hypothetical protein
MIPESVQKPGKPLSPCPLLPAPCGLNDKSLTGHDIIRTRNSEKLPIHYMVAGLFLTLIVGLQVYLGDELVWVYGLHTVPVVEAVKNTILP